MELKPDHIQIAPTPSQEMREGGEIREVEDQEVCKAHYQDFILAVDDLKSLLSDVDSLKSSLSTSNSKLQSVVGPLLDSLDSFLESRTVLQNVSLALSSISTCVRLNEICSQSNYHLSRNNLYKTPSSTLRRMLEKKIPEICAYREASEQRVRRLARQDPSREPELRSVSHRLSLLGSSARRCFSG